MIEGLINKYQEVAPQGIINAIKTAAQETGADFEYLLNKAATESNFDTNAKAKSSSATGLFQFIDNTWLDMVKKYGDKYGLDSYASQISDKNGKLCVTDCEAKKEILDLRKNPEIASLMAAEFSTENQKYLEKNTDAKVGSTELYLAHFMGAKGAANFINKREEEGTEIASAIFTKEAKANKNVFFDKSTGEARTLDEVYNFFDKKFSATSSASSGTEVSNVQKSQQFRQQGSITKVAYLTHTHNAIISPVAVPVHLHTPHPSHTLAQALPISTTPSEDEDGISAMLSANRIYAESLAFMAKQSIYEKNSYI